MKKFFDNLWVSDFESARQVASQFDTVVSLLMEEEGRIAAKNIKQIPDFIDMGLEKVALWIEKKRNQGKVLLHCYSGVDRTGLMAAAWLVHCKGVPHKRAINLVRKHISPHSFRLTSMVTLLKAVKLGAKDAYDPKQVRAYYNGIFYEDKWHPVGNGYHRDVAKKICSGCTSELDLINMGSVIVRTDGDMLDLSIEAWCTHETYDKARGIVNRLRKELRKEAPLSDIDTDIHQDDVTDLNIGIK